MNYKQLSYFWTVAKTGSITKASQYLGLTPQTLSGQIALLESELNVTLFQRAGRGLALTDAGKLALPYAERIFETGSQLEDTLRHQPKKRPNLFKVGITGLIPKSIVYRLLSSAMTLEDEVHIVCKEDKFEPLLGMLAIHKLDIVLADRPMPDDTDVNGTSHRLGHSGISFFATPKLALKHPGAFPGRLHHAPLLVMSDDSLMHNQVLRWLNQHHVLPKIVGEFDDSALMKAFGGAGTGFFTAPTVIAAELEKELNVIRIADVPELIQNYYAISVARQFNHPAVQAINESANKLLISSKRPSKNSISDNDPAAVLQIEG